MKILCVAEKPSIAKSISGILASGNGLNSRPGKDKYCRNFEFQYRMPPGRNFGLRAAGSSDGMVEMVVTSVKGHLMSQDFTESHRKWTSCSPSALFSAPIETYVSKECTQVAQNLKSEARNADVLMIWTDCDREGEHIGTEVVKVCRQANSRIEVKRAKFSAIIAK
jgi:DNA topoisomerase-3